MTLMASGLTHAHAAYGTNCTIYGYVPWTDGVTMYSKGSATCSAGYLVGVGAKAQYLNHYTIISPHSMQWKWQNAASLSKTASWNCNGTGTRNWRSYSTGQNNSAETASDPSAYQSLTC